MAFGLPFAALLWLTSGLPLAMMAAPADRSPLIMCKMLALALVFFVVACLASSTVTRVALTIRFWSETTLQPSSASPQHVGDDLWYDDVAYLMRGEPVPGDGETVLLDFEGIHWSDHKHHAVARGEITVIPMETCDHVQAYPLWSDWWYVWLNN